MYDWACEEGDVSIGTIRMLRLAKFAAMTALVAIASGIPVQAASWFEKNFYLSGPRYDAVLPPCDAALGTIQSRFATKEGRFWNSDLQLVDFDRVRQISFRRKYSAPARKNRSPRANTRYDEGVLSSARISPSR